MTAAMDEAQGTRGHTTGTDATNLSSRPLQLPSDLQAIFEQSYPWFSDAEYERRHAGIARAMEAAGTDHVLIVTA